VGQEPCPDTRFSWLIQACGANSGELSEVPLYSAEVLLSLLETGLGPSSGEPSDACGGLRDLRLIDLRDLRLIDLRDSRLIDLRDLWLIGKLGRGSALAARDPLGRAFRRLRRVERLHINVQRFRGGLVCKAHRLLYHSTLGLRVIKKKKKKVEREREREREI